MDIITKSRPKVSNDKITLSGDRIFFSIQGEGPSIGQPAVFMRLHLCNLSCAWCDTPYTWDESSEAYWNEWKQFEIAAVVDGICKYPCKRLVVTGGEPLLQQDALVKLFEELKNWEIEIETNGTIIPRQEILLRCQFNVSPKLANSTLALEKRIRAEVLKKFIETAQATFKFVVSSLQDLDEVRTLTQTFSIPAARVVIMPEGTNAPIIIERLQLLAEKSRDYGFRLLPRLHVQIWGNLRGV